jgi:hypothetical protein
MKKGKNSWIYVFTITGMLLILSGSCKKKDDTTAPAPAPQIPVFTITATTVMLQSGGDGLQFSAKCTNENVKMTSVKVTSPITVLSATYNLNGNSFAKNTLIPMQNDTDAYDKETGTWNFTFTGNRTSDNVSFSVDATLVVTGK